MKKVLVINSSARKLNSHSRNLTEVFVNHWKSVNNTTHITFRELGNENVPHIDENWIAGAFKPETARSEKEKEALKISDIYISELHQADIIVVGTPMYNWSVPSALKAYIDQVVRVNETWKLNPGNYENPYIGLLENKTVILLVSRGSQGYEKGQPIEHMNFQSNYLKTVFNVMGIQDIHLVTAEGTTIFPEIFKQTLETSHQNIKYLVDQLS